MFDPITILFLGAFLAVFWFFIIRPQTKAAKQAKEFQTSLDKGAKVVTSGGIHGKVIKVDDTSLLLEIDNNVKMRVEKSAISMEMTQVAYKETDKKPDTETK